MTAAPNIRTVLLTGLALVAFAANSLLCRRALGAGLVDAGTFTLVRLVSGAAVLAWLVAGRGGGGGAVRGRAGSWGASLALFAYAAPFSFAYLRLPAGLGALVLFGAVQATMIGVDLARGGRPRRAEWVGLVMALGGLVALTVPGATAPDAVGVGLMALAGVAWGVYSLQGRGEGDPLAATAANFARSVVWAVPLGVVVAVGAWRGAVLEGVLLAVASGALASGCGYAVWYAALGGLTATRAAVVQLLVPVLAAVGGVWWLGEVVTGRMVGAGVVVLAGVGLAVLGRR